MKDRSGKIDVVDILGLAGDIILDPTSWLPNPVSLTIKKGTKSISKTTGKLIRQTDIGAEFLDNMGRSFKQFYDSAHFDKIFGKQTFDTANKSLHKNKALQEQFVDNVDKHIKIIKKEIKKETGLKGKKLYEKFVDTGKDVMKLTESGNINKIENNIIRESVQSLQNIQSAFAKQLKTNGLIDGDIPNYVTHLLSKEASDMFKLNPDTFQTGFDLITKSKSTKRAGWAKLTNESGDSIIVNTAKGFKKAAKDSGFDFIDDGGKLYKWSRATVEEVNEHTMNKFGIKMFDDNYFRSIINSGVGSITELNKFDYTTNLLKEVGKKTDGLVKIGEGYIDPITKAKYVPVGMKGFKDQLIPIEVASDYKKVLRFMSGTKKDTLPFLQYYDKVNNTFKRSVTGWFPAFHTRNFTSGVFNNYIAGLKNPKLYKIGNDIAMGKDGIFKLKDGTEMTYKAIREAASDWNFLGGSAGMMDVLKSVNPDEYASAMSKILDAPRVAMEAVETRIRIPLFVDGLQKGMGIDEAAKRVYKYQFNYNPWGLSDFETNVLKRVIPFYNFSRNNIPLQIEQMISQTGKYAGIMKTARSMQGDITQEDRDNMGDYNQNQILAKLGNKIISGFGTPMEEALAAFQKPMSAIMGSLTPLIKIPIEKFTDYNLYKKMPISSDIYGKKYKNAPEPLKKFLGFKDIEYGDGQHFYTIDPMKKYWVDTLGMRTLSTTLGVMNMWNQEDTATQKMISAFREIVSTINTTDLTIDDLTKYADDDAIKQVNDLLKRQGLISSFEKNYIPEAQREQLGVTSTGSIPKK